MQLQEIDKNKELFPGDEIELHFHAMGPHWIVATQIAAIEFAINRNESHFQILSWRLPDKNRVIFKVRILASNPVIVTAAVIAGAIVAVGFIAFLTLDKVYQIVESPAGKIGAIGMGSLGIAVAAAVIYGIIAKGK